MIAGAREIIIAYFAVGLTLCAWGLGWFARGAIGRMKVRRQVKSGVAVAVAEFEWRRLRDRMVPVAMLTMGALFATKGYAFDILPTRGRRFDTELMWLIAMLAIACAGICVAMARTSRRRVQRLPHCPACGFDLSHLLGDDAEPRGRKCSECGHEIRTLHDLFQSRWNRRAVWLLAAILPLAYMTFAAHRAQMHGVTGFIPTTVMIGGFASLPESLIVSHSMSTKYYRTLRERMSHEALWRWQETWLTQTAERHMQSPVNIDGMFRACFFNHERRTSLTRQQCDILLDSLTSPDAEVRTRAAHVLELFCGRPFSYHGARPRFTGESLSVYLKYSLEHRDSDTQAHLGGVAEGRAGDILKAWRNHAADFKGFALLRMAGTDFDAEWVEVRSVFHSMLRFDAHNDYLDVLAALHTWISLAHRSEPARRDLLIATGGPDVMLRDVLRMAVDRYGPDSIRALLKERDATMQIMQDPTRSLAERLGAARTLGSLVPCVQSEEAVRFLLISGLDWELAERDEIAAIAGRLTPPKAE